MTTTPAPPHGLRSRHRTAALPRARNPRRGPPAQPSPAVRYTREGKRWNEVIARCHYLGYKTLVGAQMRHAVHDRHGRPPSPCSACPPPLANSRHATASSDGRRSSARRISPSWSTTPASSSSPGSPSPTSAPTSSRSCAANCPGTGPSATTPPRPHRDLRRNPALHRRTLQGLGLSPRRRHPGPRPQRPRQALRQTQKGHLAPPPPQTLAENSQPVIL